MTPTEFLKYIAPTFMWCTVYDLFLMYEQVNWEIEWHSFRQRFYQLAQRGLYTAKLDPTDPRRRRLLYIRQEDCHPNGMKEILCAQHLTSCERLEDAL